MTNMLFIDDAYQKECNATITAVNENGGIILDQTIFYPTGGGQPGDAGHLITKDGTEIKIATTIKGDLPTQIVHVPKDGQAIPQIGDLVTAKIDWDRRYTFMRMHSAMHILCAVIPCGVTGGQVGMEKSRLDFDIGEHTLDKVEITKAANELISGNHCVTAQWITDAELDAQPELVRTMSVQPPRMAGKVRLLKIGEDVDLQPCGGTHIKNTSEIGNILISKIENKGKRNRRVNIVFT